jgi:two-component system, NtrC family, sensor kinase
MLAEPIIAFFLLWDLRKILKTTAPNPVWDKNLKLAMFGVIALVIIEIVFHLTPVIVWVWHLLLIGIILLMNLNAVFSAARTLMFAVLPFVLLSFLSDVFKLLFSEEFKIIHNYIEVAMVFTIIWMVAMLIISKKQRKALEKERQKTLVEEELNFRLAEQKAQLENQVLERTSELLQQKEELEKALVELKATQTQLIQQEKLASLGELTAGIAHEIQNPLNFVNNFSEVNTELVDELHEAINKGNLNEVRAIANDIKENEEKIVFHGKRADVIVKSMLHHSRTSTGKKEPTDINVLADEYLRLAYHGLRAKDKSFNAIMKTDFDESIGDVNIIPQDIGRVILNLITNAFYAVAEKKKQMDESYHPTVFISTKKLKDKIKIKVKDNGMGIPEKVAEKIFQPFFTTKPTGQGTGLGLSLSYDIVKAHGGEIKMETKENEGAEFIIQLPVQHNNNLPKL